MNDLAPDVGFAVVRVLERIGCEVDVPADQTCCGQPAFNAGFHEEARTVARQTLERLDRTTGPIVIPSGSCGDMLVHQYPRLFDAEPEMREKAIRVAARCREFSQFIGERAPDGIGGRSEARIAYHPSCHLLRGLGVRHQPVAAIQSVDGATLMPLREQEECCGFGGLFSVKNAEISSAMLDRKLDALAASGADRVVSCDLGCLLQIGGGLHRRGSSIRAQHLAQFLDEAETR